MKTYNFNSTFNLMISRRNRHVKIGNHRKIRSAIRRHFTNRNIRRLQFIKARTNTFTHNGSSYNTRYRLSPSILLIFTKGIRSEQVDKKHFKFRHGHSYVGEIQAVPRPSRAPCSTYRARHTARPCTSADPNESTLTFTKLISNDYIVNVPSGPYTQDDKARDLQCDYTTFTPIIGA